jgi:hypothetical protein
VDQVIKFPKSGVKTSFANITVREVSEIGLPAYGGIDEISYKDLSPEEKDHIRYNKKGDPIQQLAAIKSAYYFHAMCEDEDFMDALQSGDPIRIMGILTDLLSADINLTF